MRITDFLRRTKVFQLVQTLSKRERIIFIGAMIVFVVSLFSYGTLLVQSNTYVAAADGGIFREGIVGQPVFINPVVPATTVDRDIARLVFSSVTEVADSIKRSDDGTVWNVRLKENVFWHDGERLTSDDIIFTLETIQDPDSRSPLNSSFNGVAAERISELEVQFVLQNSYAFFESDHLSNLRIIPKHIFSDIPVQNIRLSSYGLKPVGSGPYEVVSFEKGGDGIITSFELKANKRYFDGEPHIQSFIVKFYKKIEDVIRAYNLGQVDGFGMSSAEPLIENSIHIRNTPYYLVSPSYYAVFINQSLAPEALKDIETRRALSGTIDRERIIKNVFLSQATPLYGPTTKDDNPAEEYDASLLQDLELNLTVPEDPILIKTAEVLKENWESNGAKVSVNVFSLKDIKDEVLRNSDYEMILFGNITKENQDLFAFWHSSQRFYPDQNLSLYQSKSVDAMLEEFRETFDINEREEILNEISGEIAEDLPAIFLYSPRYVYIAAPRLKGFDKGTVINTSDDRFKDVQNWHVETRRALSNPEAN